MAIIHFSFEYHQSGGFNRGTSVVVIFQLKASECYRVCTYPPDKKYDVIKCLMMAV
jgi:hypothetical protein